MSDFLIIFPSDNSTVVLEMFMIFWFNSSINGFPSMLLFVFGKILHLNGLWRGIIDEEGFEGDG